MPRRFLLAMLLAAWAFPALPQQPTIALLGDSFAVGLAPYVKAKVQRTVVGGSVQYFWEDTPGIDALTHVIVVLGTNDSLEYGLENSVAYTHQVGRIVTNLTQRGREVLWVGPPCILPGHTTLSDERVREVDALQQETMARLGLPRAHHVSLRPMTERGGICSSDNREPDQVHFTPRGYEAVTRFILSQLTQVP
ncbi:MAG TPA: GDSL-type esterase/lipase family protein [Vineibacter sp.]|nr:GDSL-type esterase/lipase family protein [Vineibacter sp.]